MLPARYAPTAKKRAWPRETRPQEAMKSQLTAMTAIMKVITRTFFQ